MIERIYAKLHEKMDWFRSNPEARLSRNDVATFSAAMAFGLFAHLYVLTNHITIHDNVYSFYLGGTYELGRWMLYGIVRITDIINRNWLHYATPSWLGLLSILYLAIASVGTARILKLRRATSCVLLGGVMVCFPAVTSAFGFLFTSAAYFFGLLLGVAGVYLICRKRSPLFSAAGVVLIACSIGVYQAYLPFLVSLFVLEQIRVCVTERSGNFRALLRYAILTLMSLLVYYGVLKLCLWHYGSELSNYQGIGNSLNIGIGVYLRQIPVAYREFFRPSPNAATDTFPNGLRPFYYLNLLMLGAFSVGAIVRMAREKQKAALLEFCLLLLALPLCVKLIFVLCAGSPDTIYALMMYGEVGTILCVILFADSVRTRGLGTCALLPVLAIVLLDCRLANICYWKADYVHRGSAAYYNRMVARIEATAGYTDELPVVWIGRPQANVSTMMYKEFERETGVFPDTGICPFNMSTMLSNYNWENFVRSECGYDPITLDAGPYRELEEVRRMPCYPDDGSIRVIDGSIVVKFQEY